MHCPIPALQWHAVPHPLPSQIQAQAIRSKLLAWFSEAARDLPWRRTPTPYAVLVSEFMLQQTQVATAIPYFEAWMRRFPTLASLASASEADVLHQWQGLGYYSRARNLHATAQRLHTQYASRVPSSPETLRTLPGIGPYAAGAIAAFAFDLPVPTVDANIARVLARLFCLELPIPSAAASSALKELAQALLPEGSSGGRLHTSALMELGALLCSPKQPQCLICPLRSHCLASASNPERLPLKAPRKPTQPLEENAAWIRLNGRVLLEQHTGRRSKGLWKLPSLPTPPSHAPRFEATYPFTHHKVSLRVFETPPNVLALTSAHQWFTENTLLQEAPLTAPHRRAIQTLLSSP